MLILFLWNNIMVKCGRCKKEGHNRTGCYIIPDVIVIESIEYDNIIPPVKIPKRALTDDEIIEEIKQKQSDCSECKSSVYYKLKKWGDTDICYPCYHHHRQILSDTIQAYMVEQGLNACKFCGKIRNSVNGFHLDHINMFNKDGSVGNMIWTGQNIDEIKKEIHKCQLLCISCHSLVTYYEIKLGFIGQKSRKVQGLQQEYADKMERIYRLISETVLRGK